MEAADGECCRWPPSQHCQEGARFPVAGVASAPASLLLLQSASCCLCAISDGGVADLSSPEEEKNVLVSGIESKEREIQEFGAKQDGEFEPKSDITFEIDMENDNVYGENYLKATTNNVVLKGALMPDSFITSSEFSDQETDSVQYSLDGTRDLADFCTDGVMQEDIGEQFLVSNNGEIEDDSMKSIVSEVTDESSHCSGNYDLVLATPNQLTNNCFPISYKTFNTNGSTVRDEELSHKNDNMDENTFFILTKHETENNLENKILNKGNENIFINDSVEKVIKNENTNVAYISDGECLNEDECIFGNLFFIELPKINTNDRDLYKPKQNTQEIVFDEINNEHLFGTESQQSEIITQVDVVANEKIEENKEKCNEEVEIQAFDDNLGRAIEMQNCATKNTILCELKSKNCLYKSEQQIVEISDHIDNNNVEIVNLQNICSSSDEVESLNKEIKPIQKQSLEVKLGVENEKDIINVNINETSATCKKTNIVDENTYSINSNNEHIKMLESAAINKISEEACNFEKENFQMNENNNLRVVQVMCDNGIHSAKLCQLEYSDEEDEDENLLNDSKETYVNENLSNEIGESQALLLNDDCALPTCLAVNKTENVIYVDLLDNEGNEWENNQFNPNSICSIGKDTKLQENVNLQDNSLQTNNDEISLKGCREIFSTLGFVDVTEGSADNYVMSYINKTTLEPSELPLKTMLNERKVECDFIVTATANEVKEEALPDSISVLCNEYEENEVEGENQTAQNTNNAQKDSLTVVDYQTSASKKLSESDNLPETMNANIDNTDNEKDCFYTKEISASSKLNCENYLQESSCDENKMLNSDTKPLILYDTKNNFCKENITDSVSETANDANIKTKSEIVLNLSCNVNKCSEVHQSDRDLKITPDNLVRISCGNCSCESIFTREQSVDESCVDLPCCSYEFDAIDNAHAKTLPQCNCIIDDDEQKTLCNNFSDLQSHLLNTTTDVCEEDCLSLCGIFEENNLNESNTYTNSNKALKEDSIISECHEKDYVSEKIKSNFIVLECQTAFESEVKSDLLLPTITEEREDMSLTSVTSSFSLNAFNKTFNSVDIDSAVSPQDIDDQCMKCELKSDGDDGFKIVVGDIVASIPEIVFFMSDDANTNYKLIESYEEQENAETDEDNFLLSNLNSVKENVEKELNQSVLENIIKEGFEDSNMDNSNKMVCKEDNSCTEGGTNFILKPQLKGNCNADRTISLTVQHQLIDKLSKSQESTENLQTCDVVEDKNSRALKKKLSKFERRLSAISLNLFTNRLLSEDRKLKLNDTKEKNSVVLTSSQDNNTEVPEISQPLPLPLETVKLRRPLSGVRRKLASSRRRTWKASQSDTKNNACKEVQLYNPKFETYISNEDQDDRELDNNSTKGSLCLSVDEPKPSVDDSAPALRPPRRKLKPEKRRCGSVDENKSFGKRAQGGGRRPNECLILEPSEMMVIDYPDVQVVHPRAPSVPRPPLAPCDAAAMPPPSSAPLHHYSGAAVELPDLLRVRSRGSASDTSSAYSGSDTMCATTHEDVDLTGLMESAVDSDEDELAENVESLSVQDTVRECLEKDPSERTEADIKVLVEYTERLSAFASFTVGVRRAMCQAMVFAVVDDADTVLMSDNEELDSWSVIINGSVEVTHKDGTVQRLHLGDSFGITPTMEKLHHRGVMRSKVDDCQFVCIRQSDYYRILRQGEENTRRHEEGGVTVLVTEKSLVDACHREANIVIKGTPERLLLHLVEVENILDPTYVEDFLLTHRRYFNNSVSVAKKLLEWFDDPKYQDIVTRVFLRWVQSYFTDFEMDSGMMACLEKFEQGLQSKEMTGQLFFLRMVCMTKARTRVLTLTRPSRDQPIQFTVVGRKNFGIFVASVEKGCKAEELGLKRADQILEANGHSFANISQQEAMDIITSSCHLELTVRSNMHTYIDMLQMPENAHKSRGRKASDCGLPNGSLGSHAAQDLATALQFGPSISPALPLPHRKDPVKVASMTLKTHKFKEFIHSIVNKTSNIEHPPPVMCSDDSVSSHSSAGGHLYRSRSNPDLSSAEYDENIKSEFPDHVLKVYRATDQSTRFLPVHKETTAREVVMLALSLFNVAEPSQNYALYEVSVTDAATAGTQNNVVKQKRLPDGLQNLAERIGLSSRYYLKSVISSANLCPDEVVNELMREAQVSLLQLSSVVELAIQVTLEDFAIFRQIEPTEYIDSLFKLKSKYGIPALSKFEQISNRELFWVCTEVCSEHNVHKRSKIVKQFIKIARYCKELNNFNSMFAILSGLGSTSVNRLRQTWARVPSRYRKIFADLETVMDPSQNMKNYRKLASSSFSQAPMIPFYPIVKKDLLFLNDGNDDEVDGLINFEKLRTISKSVRKLAEMCSTKYCPSKMLERLGQPQSTAIAAMNQTITGAHQSNTVKRRKKSTAQPDKKKMFEEAQMVRRVKSYLNQLRVITDEDLLMRMSYDCEPPTVSHSIAIGSGSSTLLSLPGSGGSTSAPPTNQNRRRQHSPTPSTASSNSSNSHTSENKKLHPRFGAASPTSERKMLSLAENTKKPYHGPRPPLSAAQALSQTPLSPSPSPGAPRRGSTASQHPAATSTSVPVATRTTHERSHSDTPLNSVDLSAESSSVTSLSSFAHLRKSHTSGSVTSSDCHGSGQGETDSGISTHFDCMSSSSLEGGVAFEAQPRPPSPSSPHAQHHQRFSHQPVGSKPPFPHAVAVLPPIPHGAPCSKPRVVRRGATTAGTVTGGPVPPDYTCAQMRMTNQHIQHMGRALSHDGVPQYYHHTRHQDDDDEAQVSAV